jgi:predicted MFS family arabinose efflux permease
MFLTTAVGMMAWSTVFPLLSLLVRDLGISRGQGGILSGLFYIPGVFVSLPGSWMFNRLPFRKAFFITWSFIFLGTAIMAVSPVFFVLCVGRLLFSIGMNIHLIGALKTLAAWFEGHKRLGLVMAIYSSAISVGVFCGMNVGGKLGNDIGWRSPFYLLTVLTLVGLTSMKAMHQPSSTAVTEGTELNRRFSFKASSIIWLMAVAYFFFGTGTDSFLVFTPDFLVRRGLPLARASAIVGSYAFIALFIKLTTSPFIKARNALYFVSAGCVFGILADTLVLQRTISPIFSSIAVGAAFGIAMPAIYSLPAFLASGDDVGLAYGIYQLLTSLGIVAQWLFGHTIDATGGYITAYTLMIIFFGAGLICVLAVSKLGRRKSVPHGLEC